MPLLHHCLLSSAHTRSQFHLWPPGQVSILTLMRCGYLKILFLRGLVLLATFTGLVQPPSDRPPPLLVLVPSAWPRCCHHKIS